MAVVAGGLRDELPADAAIQKLVDKVRVSVEEKSGRKFTEFRAIAYCTQVVAGVNYFIKVCVGTNDYVMLRVYQSLDQEVTLSSYQLDKKESDPIEYFD
ncbi:PREDICTED: cystatin-B-like isoform X2 [Amphimedon queenslandica]|uniref:Cystatin domain-containing protein n=1 Tax=Amphimedon queenslandica TaxID=400682 RepID=A0A1X7U028_AMPQE|nr:PREDICTED: cystatin-B-like isoform X2 [Amphimedon queenslandica]|eukprot:XP_003389363.1 PREDICTED: cystatin-B-like isoform X2 [Amphimedon queenslandica]